MPAIGHGDHSNDYPKRGGQYEVHNSTGRRPDIAPGPTTGLRMNVLAA